jgi:hypothetical protein
MRLPLKAAGRRRRPSRLAALAAPGTLRELLVAQPHGDEDAAAELLAAAASARELRLLDVRGVPLGQRGASAAALLLRWVWVHRPLRLGSARPRVA